MARVKRSVNGKKQPPQDPRRGRGLHAARAAATSARPTSRSCTRGVRVPRPPGAQGRVPPALDRAHQRRVPRARHLVLALHRRAEGRRDRRRPQDPRRPRGARAGGLRRARRPPRARRSKLPERTPRRRSKPRHARGQAAAGAAARPRARERRAGVRRRRAARRRGRARPRRARSKRCTSEPTPTPPIAGADARSRPTGTEVAVLKDGVLEKVGDTRTPAAGVRGRRACPPPALDALGGRRPRRGRRRARRSGQRAAR